MPLNVRTQKTNYLRHDEISQDNAALDLV